MIEVCHDQIIEEIINSSLLAIMEDETMDVAAKSQLVVIFRYFPKSTDNFQCTWYIIWQFHV